MNSQGQTRMRRLWEVRIDMLTVIAFSVVLGLPLHPAIARATENEENEQARSPAAHNVRVTRHVLTTTENDASDRREYRESIDVLAWDNLPFSAVSKSGEDEGRIAGLIKTQQDGSLLLRIMIQRTGKRHSDDDFGSSVSITTEIGAVAGEPSTVLTTTHGSSKTVAEVTEEFIVTVTGVDVDQVLSRRNRSQPIMNWLRPVRSRHSAPREGKGWAAESPCGGRRSRQRGTAGRRGLVGEECRRRS